MTKDERIYLYDGTMEGLMTTVYECIKTRKIPTYIKNINEYETNLFDKILIIKTDNKKYLYTINKIKEYASSYILYQIYKVYLSSDTKKEMIILDYIIKCLKYGNNIYKYKTIDNVRKVSKIMKYVSNEAHRLKGFVRFKELTNKVLYSEISPENNVLEILSYHFKTRLSNEVWIIKDVKRNIISVYNKKDFIIIDSKEFNFDNLKLSEDEKEIKELWKQFIKNVTIKERTNLRCQMNFMPKRYWKYMCEMENEK